MMDLSGKRVVVFGLGRSGRAAVALLDRQDATIVAYDQRPPEALGEATSGWLEAGVELHLNVPPTAALTGADLIVLSPGVSPNLPVLQRAVEQGAKLIGEVELAYRFLPKDARVIGITGTNGKSTTTALTGALIETAGHEVFVGGNLGTPLSDAVAWDLTAKAYVVELSSYQLETIERFRPRAAALLNLTPDHVERHGTFEAYAEAKGRLLMNQTDDDRVIVNATVPRLLELAHRSPAKQWVFDGRVGGIPSKAEGAFAESADRFLIRTELGEGHLVVDNRSLRGPHNLENAMVAALLAHGEGVPFEALQAGLNGFKGLPHRMESVRTLDGVEYVNDSKATNVASTVVALSAFDQGVWLILGGRGKGSSYEELVRLCPGRVREVLTIGEDAPKIEAALEGVVPFTRCETLDAAVDRAHEKAVEGEVVLLSPACASQDQFRDFEDRGLTFRRLVSAL